MKTIKVALVSPYPPGKGTLNEYAYHLVEQLLKKEEVSSVEIIAEKLEEPVSYDLGSTGKLNIKEVWSFNSYLNVFRIMKAIIKSKADIVMFNIHFLSFGDKKVAAALGLLLPFLCKIFFIKNVVLLHNLIETVDLESAGITKSPIKKKLFSFIGTMLTKFLLATDLLTVTIAKYVEILNEKYNAKNVALVPHGSFESPATPVFDYEKDIKTVMTFGKFGTYKKVEELIEAVDKLRKEKNCRIKLVIAGTDSPNKIGYLESVKEKYSSLQDIEFTGYVPEEDVERTFTESDVVVFPYTSTTGSSGVLHQAGIYGKACVLPNIGDLKHLVEEEGYMGQFFIPEDVDSLAKAIGQLLDDTELRNTMARANFSAASSLPMFDIVDWYLSHFENIINKNK